MATYKDIIGGLKILSKYVKNGEDSHIPGAFHDIIIGLGKKVSPEDAEVLQEEFNWNYDEEYEHWYIHC